MVRLLSEFEGIALEARMGAFSAQNGTAHLTPSFSDFRTLTTSDLGLADKAVDREDGRMIRGDFTLLYRAKALKDLQAGRYDNVLVVSFADN